MSERKMSDQDIERFVKHNPAAYKRYKHMKLKKSYMRKFNIARKIWSVISQIILWFCAVGGFILSLIQFLED